MSVICDGIMQPINVFGAWEFFRKFDYYIPANDNERKVMKKINRALLKRVANDDAAACVLFSISSSIFKVLDDADDCIEFNDDLEEIKEACKEFAEAVAKAVFLIKPDIFKEKEEILH